MEFELSQSITILERTPSVLRTLLQGLDEDWTYQNEGGDSWSAFDVVGHLVHGEITDWIPRMQIILSDAASRRFEPFDRFAQFENSKGKSLDQLLDDFESLRKANLSKLKAANLQPEDFGRNALHPALGTTTLRQLLASWTVHDLGHIAQISRVLAKQYNDEVGPWTEYLRILHI